MDTHGVDGILAIKGWGSLSHVRNVVNFFEKDNRKVGKTNQDVNQTFTLESKHDKIWTWWTLDILLDNMFKRVWWCRHSEMEFWS